MTTKTKPGISPGPGTGKTTWVSRNPGKIIILTILLFTLFIDWIAGLIFIPTDYNSFRCPHPFYHHDLLPNRRTAAKWGEVTYPMYTNSLGFRDGAARTVSPRTSQERIVFIGDSFTEGLGVPYADSFVGTIGEKLQKSRIEVLNAGVVSYSPKFYYLKIKYLIEERRIDFHRLFVFIDNSDIPDEITYEPFVPRPFSQVKEILLLLKKFLKRTSFLYYSLSRLFHRPHEPLPGQSEDDGLFPCLAGLDEDLMNNKNFRRAASVWTLEPGIFVQFGREGLRLAKKNMQQLVNLCKQKDIDLTVVVYPWPRQIRFRDLESFQVRVWRDFARVNGIKFINLFPCFINNRKFKIIIKKYFIPRDVHWNPAGHRLVADKILGYIRPRGD